MEYSKYAFQHPNAGKSDCDGRRLAIRWSPVLPKKERLALLKRHGLQLIEAPEPSEDTKGIIRVNNTDALWWVENVRKVPIPKRVLVGLERSKNVTWIAPVYRGEQSGTGLHGLFTVNPARFYLSASIVTKPILSQLKEMKLEISINEQRSTRLKGLVALDIRNASLSGKKGVVQVAQRMVDIFKKQKGLDYKRDFHFETIPFISPTCAEFIPNDPDFVNQWGMWRINSPYAWSVSHGAPSVTVAVIDEGVELNHPDLNVHPQSWNASDDLPDGSPVGNHGTACAGIVAAKIHNGIGVAGVAGNCRVMAIATSTWADIDIAEGLYFAADSGAHVVSMSFGVYPWWGSWDLDLIRDALQYAHEKGLVLVAASGNEDISASRFPGSDPRTICVGGSNRDDVRKSTVSDAEWWWGACYGNYLDVVAPCLEIPTTDRLGAAGYDPGDFYMTFNGTSSATPHVAGLAALILSIQPSFRNETVREIIETTCDKVSPSVYAYSVVGHKRNGTWNDQVGYGRINAERAINLACQLGREERDVDLLKEIRWKRHTHTVAVISSRRRSLVPLLRQTALDRIHVGLFPMAIAFDGTCVWVTNNGSDSVSKIDIAANTVVATIGVGHRPRGLTFDGTHVWVSNSGSDNVSKIDVASNTVVATIGVGQHPRGLAFDGTHVWAANNGSNDVSKIDIASNALLANIGIGWQSLGPEELCFDGNHIWVTHHAAYPWLNNVSKIDFVTNAVVSTMRVGRGPYGLVFDGTHIWVANYHDDTVSKINVSANVVIASISVGHRPYGLAFDGTHIWVSNHHSHNLSKIDVGTDLLVKTVGLGCNPAGLAFDGIYVWAASISLRSPSPLAHYVTKVPALSLGVELPSSALDGGL